MHSLPNILSGLRIILAPVFLILFFQDDFVMKVIGLGVYIIAAITDYYDGYYARNLGFTAISVLFLIHWQINF